jgi:hypothetical protein
MFYLSIDVANKSLAISFLKFNKENSVQLNNINNSVQLNNINNSVQLNNINNSVQLNKQLNNIIRYYICEVIDLIPNKKVRNTSQIERTIALKKYLMQLQLNINNYINISNINKIKVLIELQPSFNDKSRAAFNQIIYEFSNKPLYKIKIMNASYKNLISLNKNLTHSKFIQKYSNNYLANKNHTKENFLHFLKTFNLMHLIKNIKKKNYDDIADSFMQAIAYIYILEK